MKAIVIIAASLILLSLALVKPKTVGERFIMHMNNYDTDSLSAIIDDGFELTRTYVKISHTKSSFLKEYIPLTQRLHARFNIKEQTTNTNPEVFIVEDQSDFFTFLMIDPPKWKLNIYKNDKNLISKVVMDTTQGYAYYVKTGTFMSNKFEYWLRKYHPGETLNILTSDTNNLYSKRLIEYRDYTRSINGE
jgi:hypothetical protein